MKLRLKVTRDVKRIITTTFTSRKLRRCVTDYIHIYIYLFLINQSNQAIIPYENVSHDKMHTIIRDHYSF